MYVMSVCLYVCMSVCMYVSRSRSGVRCLVAVVLWCCDAVMLWLRAAVRCGGAVVAVVVCGGAKRWMVSTVMSCCKGVGND